MLLLIRAENMYVESKYIPIVQACLSRINDEMCRLYWNEYQEELESPFDNTGNEYKNDTFIVRSYYWGTEDERESLPNFSYKGLTVHWYKHFKRGMYAEYDGELSLDFLADMVDDCCRSLERDYYGKRLRINITK